MTSHEYARELQKTVEHLLGRPEVQFEDYASPHQYISFWDKDKFVAAARAMGAGKKEFRDSDLHFVPDGRCLVLSIGRDKVCRKIQDAKWECEPILSDTEVEQLGEVSVPTDEDIPF
jgi:hypothetical protein